MPPRKRPRRDDPTTGMLRALRALGIPHAKLPQVIAAVKDVPEILESDCRNLDIVSRRLLAEDCGRFTRVERITLDDGEPFDWHYFEPNKLMRAVLLQNKTLAAAVASTLRDNQQSWAIIWTADETYVGNPLHESGRKTWGASFSFGAFSRAQLSQSAFWWSPGICRSKKLGKIPGGASRLFSILLRQQLHNEEDGLGRCGCPLTIGDESFLLFGRFRAFLGDGDSWRMVLECKSASGLRPCPFDRNVWAKGSRLAHRKPGHVEITCCKKAELTPHTTASLRGVIRDVQAAEESWRTGRGSKTRYEDLCKVSGFQPSRFGVWSNAELAGDLAFPLTIVVDWVHTLLQEGPFNMEFACYIAQAGPGAGDAFAMFFSGWIWHMARSRDL